MEELHKVIRNALQDGYEIEFRPCGFSDMTYNLIVRKDLCYFGVLISEYLVTDTEKLIWHIQYGVEQVKHQIEQKANKKKMEEMDNA